MRIKLRLGMIVDGVHHEIGDELDVEVAQARLFISSNQAVALDPLPPAPPLMTRAEIEHRDPRPQHRDPRPQRT